MKSLSERTKLSESALEELHIVSAYLIAAAKIESFWLLMTVAGTLGIVVGALAIVFFFAPEKDIGWQAIAIAALVIGMPAVMYMHARNVHRLAQNRHVPDRLLKESIEICRRDHPEHLQTMQSKIREQGYLTMVQLLNFASFIASEHRTITESTKTGI